MRTIVLGLGAVAVAIWSALAFIAHLLIDVLGGYGARNADALPLPPDLIVAVSEGLRLVTGVGGPVVVTVWAIGAGIIAMVTLIGMFVASRVSRRDTAMRAPDPRFPHFESRGPSRRYGAGLVIGQAIGRILKGRNSYR